MLMIYLAQYIPMFPFQHVVNVKLIEIVHILKKIYVFMVLVLQNLVCLTVTAQVNLNWADFESSVAVYGY